MGEVIVLVIIVAIMLLGLEILTKMVPGFNKVYHWLLKMLVFRPIKFVWKKTLPHRKALIAWLKVLFGRALRLIGSKVRRGVKAVWVKLIT